MVRFLLGAVVFCVFIVLIRSGRKHRTPAPEDADSVEVFRAAPQVAEQALHMLCDGGIAAWLEHCEDRQLAIHVEKDDIPSVRQVLKEAGMQHA